MSDAYPVSLNTKRIPLIQIRPRMYFTNANDWTFYQEIVPVAIFYISIPKFPIHSVVNYTGGNTTFTEVFDIPSMPNTFWNDMENGLLWIMCANTGQQITDGNEFLIQFGIYVSTEGYAYYKNLSANTGAKVFYEPRARLLPTKTTGSVDTFFGYEEINTSRIELNNSDGFFDPLMGVASFHKATFLYYILSGQVTDNLSSSTEFITGYAETAECNDSIISVSITTDQSAYDIPVLDIGVADNYQDDANIDPRYNGGDTKIRRIFGRVDGMVPVNLDYVEKETATTSDNRNWGIAQTGWALGISKTIVQSGTLTKTYLGSNKGFNVGDCVWLERVASAGADNYVRVLTIGDDGGNEYITHDALPSFTIQDDVAHRSYVGFIDIVQNGIHYYPLYGRDYTEAAYNAYIKMISFSASMEANLSMPETFSPNDRITCRVYGPKIGGDPGSYRFNSTTSLGFIRDWFINRYTLPTQGGLSLSLGLEDEIGFAIPEDINGDSPTYKEILTKLNQTGLVQSGRVSAPVGNGNLTRIDDTVIEGPQLEWEFDGSDVYTTVVVEYDRNEISPHALAEIAEKIYTVSSSSTIKSTLFGISRTYTTRLLHILQAEAQTACDRLLAILSERKGFAKGRVNARISAGTTVGIYTKALPGKVRDEFQTTRKTGVVLQSVQDIDGTELIISDQKGIEDNADIF